MKARVSSANTSHSPIPPGAERNRRPEWTGTATQVAPEAGATSLSQRVCPDRWHDRGVECQRDGQNCVAMMTTCGTPDCSRVSTGIPELLTRSTSVSCMIACIIDGLAVQAKHQTNTWGLSCCCHAPCSQGAPPAAHDQPNAKWRYERWIPCDSEDSRSTDSVES